MFGGGAAAPAPTPAPALAAQRPHRAWPGLFTDEYEFAKTALTQLAPARDWLQWSTNDAEQGLAITAPPDLQERLRQLPREVRSSNDRYELCADPARVKQAIEQARQARAEEETWPQLHYLWPQHPIMDWLVDRVITCFGRHRAPVIQSQHLHPGEQAFVMLGLVPNRKGQPLLVDWQVACRRPGQPFTLEPYEAFVQRAGLKAGQLPNPGLERPVAGRASSAAGGGGLHAPAHGATAGRLCRRRCSSACRAPWRTWSACRPRKCSSWNLRLEKQLEQVRRSRFEQRSRVISRVFDEYRQWVEDTLTTEPQPYLRSSPPCAAEPRRGARPCRSWKRSRPLLASPMKTSFTATITWPRC